VSSLRSHGLYGSESQKEAEPEIDIGAGSFESLRRGKVETLHRNPAPKEEAKLRDLANRLQKATKE